MWWKCVLLITCLRLSSCEIIVPPAGEDWWESSIIYEIFPLSFKDSDGDGFGDFKGVIQKLDYLADIGVTAIWLTPFLESPLKSGGYDITNYLVTQKVFGTIEVFKELIDAAHEKDIKVIMDFVPNHTSDEHEWFTQSLNKSSKYADYYVWKDAKNKAEMMKNNSAVPEPPTNWLNVISVDHPSAWWWHETRQQFYFSQFIYNLPELNFHEEVVHDEMKRILNYWLEIGIDGIRIDALKHVYESKTMLDEPVINKTTPVKYEYLDHIYTTDQDEVYDLIKEWRLILDEYKQKYGTTRIIMTESYSTNDVLFKYYTCGAQIPTNFRFVEGNHYRELKPKDYVYKIRDWITQMPLGATYNAVFQNHDRQRVTRIFVDGMNALSLFLPGVAIVYYGGEIGMEDISDEINYSRSPMQWNSSMNAGFTDNNNGPWIELHPEYVTNNVQTEVNDPKSHLNFFKFVSKLKQTDTFKKGGLAAYVFNEDVLVLNRFLPGHANYTLVFNMGSNAQHIRLSDQITNLHGSQLNVISSSKNSNFEPGYKISTEMLMLSSGETIILTDYMTSEPTPSFSSSNRVYTTIYVILFCLYISRY